MWQMCLLPCWRERIRHSWFACSALYNKLKLGSTKMFFVCLFVFQTQQTTHYIEPVSSVVWTDLKGLDPSSCEGGVELPSSTLQHHNGGRYVCAATQENVKDRAHLGCVGELMKRSAGTFRALCSCEASYSMGGVIKATIRLSNRPPSSDFSALTKSWWFMFEKNNIHLTFIGLCITFNYIWT